MEKIIYYCDHCGKELNIKKDYIDCTIELPDRFVNTDICTKCYGNLKNLMLAYIKKEKIKINSD